MKLHHAFGAVLLALCLPVAAQSVSGTASYRARMALPPQAVLQVTLEDVSLADVPAKRIATLEQATEGRQVPFAFELRYALADIDPSRTYALRATLRDGGTLLFTTVRVYPVITRGAPNQVALELQPVRAAPPPPLVGTRWLLREAGGVAVSGAADLPAAYLQLRDDGRYAGLGGCNQNGGGYRLHGAALSFTLGPSTLMACPPPLDAQEARVLQALQSCDNFSLDGAALLLRQGNTVVARYEAGAPR